MQRTEAKREIPSEPQQGTDAGQGDHCEFDVDDRTLDGGVGPGGSTARITVVGDVVGVGRDLEHAAVETANVVVVNQQEIGWAIPHGGAVVDGPAGRPETGDGVGLVEEGEEGDEQAHARKVDVEVQVVVGHVHPFLAGLAGLVRGPLGGAGEVAVRGGKGRLPHLAELVQEPGDGGLVGLVVEHDDGPLLAEDHLPQGRPRVQGHGQGGRSVDVPDQARVDDGGGEVARVDEVVVADQDGDDVGGVRPKPLGHLGQVVLQRADVEQVARRVTEVHGPVDVVGLELYCDTGSSPSVFTITERERVCGGRRVKQEKKTYTCEYRR